MPKGCYANLSQIFLGIHEATELTEWFANKFKWFKLFVHQFFPNKTSIPVMIFLKNSDKIKQQIAARWIYAHVLYGSFNFQCGLGDIFLKTSKPSYFEHFKLIARNAVTTKNKIENSKQKYCLMLVFRKNTVNDLKNHHDKEIENSSMLVSTCLKAFFLPSIGL